MFATQKIVAGIGNLRAKQTTKSLDLRNFVQDDGGRTMDPATSRGGDGGVSTKITTGAVLQQ